MEPCKKPREQPEAKIQADIICYLRNREWFVKRMIGNAHQSGVPDLFACHKLYGQRWIEIKHPTKYHFTAAQIQYFPLFVANGSGIWIMCAATAAEYKKLFTGCNWHLYMSTMK